MDRENALTNPPNPSADPAHLIDPTENERLRLIWNERRRLEAMFINNVGVAVIVTGVVTPVVANLYGVTNAPNLSWLTNAGLVLMCIIAGVGLNWFAASWLKGLE
jgi:Trk-type K+ transport system membrane component